METIFTITIFVTFLSIWNYLKTNYETLKKVENYSLKSPVKVLKNTQILTEFIMYGIMRDILFYKFSKVLYN